MMRRLSRINTIWRKELRDTLRDRRTLAAMVLLPMVIYPVLMLGSLMAFEANDTRIKSETFVVGVTSEPIRDWLQRMIDTDLARRTASPDIVGRPDSQPAPRTADARHPSRREAQARADLFSHPPEYRVVVVEDLTAALNSEEIQVGVQLEGPPPADNDTQSTRVTLLNDAANIRSNYAQVGLQGVLVRVGTYLTQQRLKKAGLSPDFVRPLVLDEVNVAPPERMSASVLAQIVPLILIVMTIMGGIYPAIDLTAGERERGTLETLMVAPVPSVDLIAGKFIVVALIGMLSAALNLLSIAGTIYLSGAGDALAGGNALAIPLSVLPWVFLLLLPLAVLFSAALLAVCSFARSFKEAQNYVMPVMMAALIPAIVGILPGARLSGPLVIMPVTNIVLLTRDLFLGQAHISDMVWVIGSTSLYAIAAVAIAARLFGQEAVQFNDNGAVRTLFMRKFFKPTLYPNAAQALLLLAIAYTLNFFWQQALLRTGMPPHKFIYGVAAIMLILFVSLPLATALYFKLRVPSSFSLELPSPAALACALMLGSSTWILGRAWLHVQNQFLPMPPELLSEYEKVMEGLAKVNAWQLLLLVAAIPAVCEEWLFRGYALSGLRATIGKWGAVLAVAAAFALFHQSLYRLAITFALGLLLGLLVVQFRSLFPAIIVHAMYNGLTVASAHQDLLGPWVAPFGFDPEGNAAPPAVWTLIAGIITALGVLIAFVFPAAERRDSITSGSAAMGQPQSGVELRAESA
jgi:sodium transport system permease protein